jgi:hypothetical protein
VVAGLAAPVAARCNPGLGTPEGEFSKAFAAVKIFTTLREGNRKSRPLSSASMILDEHMINKPSNTREDE